MVSDTNFSNGSENLTSDIQSIINPEGELCLRFYLPSGQEFALPATAIAEVLQQPPEKITPIPNASPLLLGTMNLRGKIIWVADLAQFLGDKSLLNTDRSEIPVIAIEDQELTLGLAIEQVADMDWLDLEKLQIVNTLPQTMSPFVKGQWVSEDKKQNGLSLLDHTEILRSARWAV